LNWLRLVVIVVVWAEWTRAEGEGHLIGLDQTPILRAVELSLHHAYSAAESIFDSLQKIYPDHPAPEYFHALLKQMMMMDYETDLYEKEFLLLAERSLKKSETILKLNPANVWAQYFLASILVTRSIYWISHGQILQGSFGGLAGIERLEKLVKQEPTFYDAYFYLAIYRCLKYELSHKLWWRFIKRENRINEGLSLLELIHEKGTFSRFGAIQALLYFYAYQKEFVKAKAVAQKLLEQYPNNRFGLWGLAKIYFENREYAESKKIFQQLLELTSAEKMPGRLNEVSLSIYLARCSYELGDVEAYGQYIDRAGKTTLDAKSREKLSEDLKDLESLRDQINGKN